MKTIPILIVLVAALGPPALAGAQSLADVARVEATRRKAVAAPGRVYTNASLPAVPPPPPAVEAPAIAPVEPETDLPAPPTDVAGFDDRDEPYWRKKSNGIRRQLSQHRDDVSALLVSATAPVGGPAGQAERALTLTALAAAQADLSALEAEWLELEKEAQIAKVPAAWLR